ERLEAQAKAAVRPLQIEIGDLRAGRAPVAVAHEEGDSTQHLDVAETDPAQGAVLERQGNEAGFKLQTLGHRLRRAVEDDRAIGLPSLRRIRHADTPIRGTGAAAR